MSAPISKKQVQAEQTRERLLDAATREFAARGYSVSSVKAIAESAAISQGSIFWHFKSKEGLLIAVVDRAFQAWEREVLAPLLAADVPTSGVRPVVQAHLEFAKRSPEIGQRLFLTLACEALSGNAEIRAAFARIYARLRSHGREWIERAIERGTCRADIDANATAGAIVGAIAGISLQWLIDADGLSADDAHRDLAAVLERGLAPNGERRRGTGSDSAKRSSPTSTT